MVSVGMIQFIRFTTLLARGTDNMVQVQHKQSKRKAREHQENINRTAREHEENVRRTREDEINERRSEKKKPSQFENVG